MAIPEPTFTIGIEEEYLLVDKETRDSPAALSQTDNKEFLFVGNIHQLTPITEVSVC